MSETIKIHSKSNTMAKPSTNGKVRTGERRPDGTILQHSLYFNWAEDTEV